MKVTIPLAKFDTSIFPEYWQCSLCVIVLGIHEIKMHILKRYGTHKWTTTKIASVCSIALLQKEKHMSVRESECTCLLLYAEFN